MVLRTESVARQLDAAVAYQDNVPHTPIVGKSAENGPSEKLCSECDGNVECGEFHGAVPAEWVRNRIWKFLNIGRLLSRSGTIDLNTQSTLLAEMDDFYESADGPFYRFRDSRDWALFSSGRG